MTPDDMATAGAVRKYLGIFMIIAGLAVLVISTAEVARRALSEWQGGASIPETALNAVSAIPVVYLWWAPSLIVGGSFVRMGRRFLKPMGSPGDKPDDRPLP